MISHTGDTMLLHKALRSKGKFLEAMVKAVNTHERCKHWKIQTLASVPNGAQVLDSIWAM